MLTASLWLVHFPVIITTTVHNVKMCVAPQTVEIDRKTTYFMPKTFEYFNLKTKLRPDKIKDSMDHHFASYVAPNVFSIDKGFIYNAGWKLHLMEWLTRKKIDGVKSSWL